MKRKTLSMLLVLAVLILAVPAGIVAAKSADNTIAFDLEGDWTAFEPTTGDPIQSDATAILTGKINEKNGRFYLTPLNGTITIGDVEYPIHVKEAKQSEPIYQQHYELDTQYVYMDNEDWICFVEVNIDGDKLVGKLYWYDHYKLIKINGKVYESEGTDLEFSGVVDGNWVDCLLSGDLPQTN